jgi:hypothetical protein
LALAGNQPIIVSSVVLQLGDEPSWNDLGKVCGSRCNQRHGLFSLIRFVLVAS